MRGASAGLIGGALAVTSALMSVSTSSCSSPPQDYAQPYATYTQTSEFGDGPRRS